MRENRLPLPELDGAERGPVPRNVAGHLQRLSPQARHPASIWFETLNV